MHHAPCKLLRLAHNALHSPSYVMFAAGEINELHLPKKGSPVLVAIAYTVQCVYGGIHVHVITLLYSMLVTKTKVLR